MMVSAQRVAVANTCACTCSPAISLYVQLDPPKLDVLDFAKSVAVVVQQLCACRNVLSSINGNSVITVHHLDLHSTVWLIAADTKVQST